MEGVAICTEYPNLFTAYALTFDHFFHGHAFVQQHFSVNDLYESDSIIVVMTTFAMVIYDNCCYSNRYTTVAKSLFLGLPHTMYDEYGIWDFGWLCTFEIFSLQWLIFLSVFNCSYACPLLSDTLGGDVFLWQWLSEYIWLCLSGFSIKWSAT